MYTQAQVVGVNCWQCGFSVHPTMWAAVPECNAPEVTCQCFLSVTVGSQSKRAWKGGASGSGGGSGSGLSRLLRPWAAKSHCTLEMFLGRLSVPCVVWSLEQYSNNAVKTLHECWERAWEFMERRNWVDSEAVVDKLILDENGSLGPSVNL